MAILNTPSHIVSLEGTSWFLVSNTANKMFIMESVTATLVKTLACVGSKFQSSEDLGDNQYIFTLEWADDNSGSYLRLRDRTAADNSSAFVTSKFYGSNWPVTIGRHNYSNRVYVATSNFDVTVRDPTNYFQIMDSNTFSTPVLRIVPVGSTNKFISLSLIQINYIALEPYSFIDIISASGVSIHRLGNSQNQLAFLNTNSMPSKVQIVDKTVSGSIVYSK